MKKCLVTGSFDPFTIGHLDLVKRAANLFDVVFVAILNNEEKKSYFSKKQRIMIAKEGTKAMHNVKVVGYEGWTIDLAKELEIDYLVRGIRNNIDYKYECEMAEYNKMLGDKETVCLFTDARYTHISSTILKEKLARGDYIGEYVAEGTRLLIERLYKEGGTNDKY